MRKTARALILNDRKILLLSGHGADYYWTPGGGIEILESADEAIIRELNEELCIKSAEYRFFCTYVYDDQDVTNYLVTTTDDIKISAEISDAVWATKEDIINHRVKVSKGFYENAFMTLLNNDLL